MALVGAQFVNAVSPNPVGSLQAYAGASAPTGWLMCDGTSYSTSVYPDLFSVLGYTYGGSSGNFNVPDLRGRVPIGAGTGAQNGGTGSGVISGGTSLTARSRGAFGGDERLQTHTHTGTTGNMNSNNVHQPYVVSPGGHTWGADFGGTGGFAVFKFSPSSINGGCYGNVPLRTEAFDINHQHNFTTNTHNQSTGTGANMPPFVVTNYIIKALPDVPRQGQALGTTPPIVTALPVNPQFGEVVTYAADATNGVYWDLQYDASGTYPWKFIGGGPLTASSTAGLSGTISNTGFVAGTPDLAVALPLSGDYWTTTTALATNNTAGAWWMLGLNGPGSAVVDQFCARVMQHANGNYFTNGAHSIKRTFTSSGTVQMQYRVTAGIATIAERGFSLTPIRVAA
jgi:microcystin-dependent protein